MVDRREDMKDYTVDDFFRRVNLLCVGVPLVDVYSIKNKIKAADRIFLIGNGGSAAICDHIANDLMKRCYKQAISLSSPALTTCLANDYGFDNMFAEYLLRFRPYEDDLLIAISSSGRSMDILKAISLMDEQGSSIIGLAGFDGWPETIDDLLELNVHFDSHNYGEVEMATELILHAVVEDMVLDNEGRKNG